jgi:hypothetical protein
MIETTKKVLYATVGAPVLTAKRVNEKFGEITTKLRDRNLGEDLRKEFDAWAAEGEKLVDRLGDQPVVEEWGTKLEDIKVAEGVSKLREQLDDMIANWRKIFRPNSENAEDVAAEEADTTGTDDTVDDSQETANDEA